MTKRQRSPAPAEVSPEAWRVEAQGKPLAVLYARISPTPEIEGIGSNYSINSQLHESRAYAETQGYHVAATFADQSYSGKDLDRPNLDQVRDIVGKKLIDAVIVFSTDRLSRRAVHLMLIKDECDKHSVKLMFVRDRFDDTPEGKLMLGIKGHLDEYEREKIRERSARGRRQKAREGYVPSRVPPFGYRYIGRREKCRGVLEIIPEQAAIVKLIFTWYVDEGLTLYKVRARLNEQGLKSARGGKWSRTTVYQVLRNATYTGTITATGGIPVEVPKIIEPDIYWAAQKRLSENRSGRAGRTPKYYLLSAMLFCLRCRRRCYAKGIPYRPGCAMYRCGNYDTKTFERHCDAPQVLQHKLDTVVWNAVWEQISDDRNLWRLVEEYYSERSTGSGDERAGLQQKIERLRAQEKRAEEVLLDPDSPLARAKERLAQIRIELLQAEAQLRRTGEIRPMPKKQAITVLCREIQAQEPRTFEDKRAVLETLGAKVYYFGGTVEIYGAIPLASPAIAGAGASGPGGLNCHSHVPADDNKIFSIPFKIKRLVA